MRNLEQSIREWRQQMIAGGLKSQKVLDELEGHLREEAEQLIRSGRSMEEAFAMAVRRVGNCKTLCDEFGKVAATTEQKERKLKIMLMILSSILYASPILLNASKLLSRMSSLLFALMILAVVLTIASIFSGFFTWRFLPIIRNKRTRMVIQTLAGVSAAVWMLIFIQEILPSFDFNVGQMTVALVWAILPLGILCGLINGLDEAARRRAAIS